MSFSNDRRFWEAIPALFVLVGFVLATVAGTATIQTSRRGEQGAQFRQSVTQAHATIDSVVEQYITLIAAGKAFVQSTRWMDRQTFADFTRGLALRKHYPGFQALGFAERIPFSGQDAFAEGMRRNGDPDYKVITQSEAGDLYPIKFIEPRDERNRRALGYDMFGEPVRREAMARARDTDAPAATFSIILRQEGQNVPQQGFLIYLPVYEAGSQPESIAAREEAIRGFVYGAFRTGDLLDALRKRFGDMGVVVEVSERTPEGEAVIFRSAEIQRGAPAIAMPYSFAGQTWNIVYSPTAAVLERNAGSNLEKFLVPVGGGLAAILLSWFVYRENRANRTALDASLARERAENSLRLQTQVIEVAREPILILDGEGRILTWNVGCEQLYGYSREEAVGHKSFELLRTIIPMPAEKFWQKLLSEGRISSELTHHTKSNQQVVVEARLETFSTAEGIRILKSDREIGERKEAERQQRLLVREMSHRVKNLLAVVQSIVNNTIPPGRGSDQIRQVLISRLHALSRAQDIVTQSNEQGADLLQMIHRQFEGQDNRITIEGDHVVASANFAQMFALVIHELATNAAKYGSLSSPSGRVHVSLRAVTDEEGEKLLAIEWIERGGPPAAVPAVRGFGTRLIVSALSAKRGQRPVINFDPAGLEYRVRVPMSAVELHQTAAA